MKISIPSVYWLDARRTDSVPLIKIFCSVRKPWALKLIHESIDDIVSNDAVRTSVIGVVAKILHQASTIHPPGKWCINTINKIIYFKQNNYMLAAY